MSLAGEIASALNSQADSTVFQGIENDQLNLRSDAITALESIKAAYANFETRNNEREEMKRAAEKFTNVLGSMKKSYFKAHKKDEDFSIEIIKAYNNFRTKVYNFYKQNEDKQSMSKALFNGLQQIEKIRAWSQNSKDIQLIVTYLNGAAVQMVKLPYQTLIKADGLLYIDQSLFDMTSDDPYNLRINSTALIKYIKNNNIMSETIGEKTAYERYKNTKYTRKNEKGKFIYEKDDNIGKKAQSGFVAESMVRAFLTNTEYSYEQDNIPGYKIGDIITNEAEYQVKNLIEGDPTVMASSTIITQLAKIINIMSYAGAKEKLKNSVFNSAVNSISEMAAAGFETNIVEEIKSLI